MLLLLMVKNSYLNYEIKWEKCFTQKAQRVSRRMHRMFHAESAECFDQNYCCVNPVCTAKIICFYKIEFLLL